MKKTLILSIAIFSFIFAKSQPAWKWAYESGGSTATNNYDVTYGVTKDANYNIISCGIYQGSNIAIGNNTFTSANRNMWVGKQDVNGQWLWSISGDYATSNQAIYVYGVTTNSVGDVIVCGNHTGNVNIGGWAMSQSIGVNDGFVMKLNGNTGAVIWIIPLETKTYVTCAVTPLSVTCDASNNIFVAGQYKGYVKIGGITNLSSSSNTTGYTYDGMVAKINNAGTCLWFKSVYSDVAVGNADKTCFNIATDAAGNVYTVGYFANTVARLDATFSVTNSGVATTNDAFLAKYSNNGIPMNIWRFASSNTSSQDYLFGIDLMPDGNLALCGAFLSKAIVYKVNISDGTILNTIEPTGSTSNSTLYDIDSDASGNLYSCGSVQGVSPGLMFGTIPIITEVTGIAQTDNLLVKINTSNQWEFAFNYGSNSTVFMNEYARSLVVLDVDDIAVGGVYASSMTLGSTTLTAEGNCDFYVAHYAKPCTISNSINQVGNTLTAQETGANYKWLDCNNNNAIIPGATSQNYSPLINGNYSVIVSKNACLDTSACVSITTVSVLEIINSESINIYPNPTNTALNINVFTPTSISIANLLGQKLLTHKVQSSETISVSNFENGIYFVKDLNTGKTIKFIKN